MYGCGAESDFPLFVSVSAFVPLFSSFCFLESKYHVVYRFLVQGLASSSAFVSFFGSGPLLVWWYDVLGVGVLSCLVLLLSWRFLFSWLVLVVYLLSLLLELLRYLECCFRIGFLGCVLSLFLDLELCVSL